MPDRNAALKTLLGLAEDPCPEKRETLLKALTEMFERDAHTLSPQRIALYGEVFEVLAYSLPSTAREALSIAMSKQELAPANLLQLLARDVIAVAEPVLKYSTQLSEGDLLDVLAGCETNVAHAIAKRRDLTPALVHQILFFEGTAPLIITNGFAQISYEDFRELHSFTQEETSLIEPLLARVDLPDDILNAMLFSAPVHRHLEILKRTERLNEDDINLTLSISDLQFNTRSHQDPGLVAQAKRQAAMVTKDGQLGSAYLEDLLRRGGGIEFTAALSHLARLDYSFTEELLKAPHPTGIAVLCRALDLPKATFSAILLLSHGGRRRSPEQVSQGVQMYPKVTNRAAKNVLRFWRHFSTPLEKVAAA